MKPSLLSPLRNNPQLIARRITINGIGDVQTKTTSNQVPRKYEVPKAL
jgi:hypothetical protein